jgi:hypothetical protein
MILPYKAKAKVKEVAAPKFYFFDCGVVNALAENLVAPPEAAPRGFLYPSQFGFQVFETRLSE